MSHIITFDTLAYANKLKNAGMDQKLAEAQAQVQAELLATLMDDQLATKQDILGTKQEIKELRTELRSEIKSLRQEIKQEMLTLESRLMMKLGGTVVTGVGLLATLITLLHIY